MNDFRNSVKQVMVVFLFLFVALITYIAYFQAFKASDIAADEGNRRIWAERNKVVRGTIYDRNGIALTKGERTGVLTQSREYVYGDLFAHTLGYVSPTYGLTGLESTYDKELTTYSSIGTNFRDIMNDFSLNSLKEAFSKRNEDIEEVGNSIKTTLDVNIQKAAYDALGDRKGAVVALNPSTGEILAMVSKPTFDPNNLQAAMEAANSGAADGLFINRTIAGLYPPGSTFKTITTASALENIPNVEDEIFKDNGTLVFNNSYSLSNAGGAAHGNIDLKQAFAYSSNVVFGTLAGELGNEKLKATAESFGFNKNIDAIGFKLTKSTFPTLKDYEVGMIAQSGIGQSSIAATPMQMALVASTIANNGVMMKPKLTNQVIDMNGNVVKNIDSEEYANPISSNIAKTIKEYMVNLVESNGGMYYLQKYDVAGKTGTADHSDDEDSTPHSWFIGFAPADNPQIAVAVIVENGGWGAQVAAPVAGKVISAALG